MKHWLTGANPLVDFALRADGMLTFENAAVAAGVASAPAGYRARWSRFDNTTGPVGDAVETTMQTTSGAAPPAVTGSEFVQVELSAEHPEFASWSVPVRVHFRRAGEGWRLVGVQRLP